MDKQRFGLAYLRRLAKARSRVADKHVFYRNSHFEVAQIAGEPIVRVTRLAEVFTSRTDTVFAFRPMIDALDALGRVGKALLFDSRQAIAKNDPEYESWMAPYRREVIRGYAWAVFVINTPVGRLQSNRLLQVDDKNDRCKVFNDFEEALAFLIERKPEFLKRTSLPPRTSLRPRRP